MMFRLTISTLVTAFSFALAAWTVLAVSPGNVVASLLVFVLAGLLAVSFVSIPVDFVRYVRGYYSRSR